MSEIEAAVSTIIKAKVAEALAGERGGIIEQLVNASLSKKIKIPRRGGYGEDEVVFLDFSVARAIDDAVERAAREVIQERQPAITALIREKMADPLEKMAVAIVDALATNHYSANLQIKVDRNQ